MPAPRSPSRIFDPDQVLELSQGDLDFTRTLATRLLQTNRDDLEKLFAAHAAGAAEAVAARAHRIRGGCMIVGALAVAAQADELEARIETRGLDAASARATWRLARRLLELERALLAWLSSAAR